MSGQPAFIQFTLHRQFSFLFSFTFFQVNDNGKDLHLYMKDNFNRLNLVPKVELRLNSK